MYAGCCQSMPRTDGRRSRRGSFHVGCIDRRPIRFENTTLRLLGEERRYSCYVIPRNSVSPCSSLLFVFFKSKSNQTCKLRLVRIQDSQDFICLFNLIKIYLFNIHILKTTMSNTHMEIPLFLLLFYE